MSKTTKTNRCRYIPDSDALEKLRSSLRSTKRKSSSLGHVKLPSCRGVPVEIQPKHDRAYCSFRKKRCGLRKTKKSSNSSSSSSSHSYRQSYKTGQVLNMTYPYTGFDWAENSCYLAAIVQLILHQDPLVDFITDKPTSYPTISILQELLTKMRTRSTIKTPDFADTSFGSFRYDLSNLSLMLSDQILSGEQADSREILNLLLSSVENVEVSPRDRGIYTNFEKLYCCEINTERTCTTCDLKSSKKVCDYPLSLAFKSNKTKTQNIHSLLNYHFRTKLYRDHQEWRECDDCLSKIKKDDTCEVKIIDQKKEYKWVPAVFLKKHRIPKTERDRGVTGKFTVRVDTTSLVGSYKLEDPVLMPVAPPPLPPTTDILIVENTRDPLYSERLRVLSAYREDTSIAYLPETLFIHFKRFEYVSPEKMKKINTRVNFPEILDLDKYVDGSKGRSTTQYRLKGAVHHSGGFNFGHYYCYNMVINSRDKPEWIKFNDNIVSRVEDQVEGRVPSEILTSDKEAVPYILAYQKIDRPVKKYEPLDETVSDSEEESRSGEGDSGSGESGSDESDGICVEEYIINGLVFNVATDSENLLDVYVQRDPDDVGDNEHIGNLKDHLEIDTRSLASMDYDEKRELINVYLIEGLKDMLSKNIIPDDIVPIITESL